MTVARNVAILGATRGMGQAVARRLAERGDRLFLLGRDPHALERTADDLAARSPQGYRPQSALLDLEAPGTVSPALEAAAQTLGGFDTVVCTAGLFGTTDQLRGEPERAARMVTVNFSHTLFFLEEAKRRLLARGGGTLCAFGSVAGDRGRKPAALYGASKAGLAHYLEALDHRHHGDGLRVVCVKPGFVRTGMTEGLPEPPFAADPDPVAEDVVRALDRGTPVVYTPSIWQWVMAVIRRLPRLVMRRVGF